MEGINHPGLITDDYLHTEDELYVTPGKLEERYGIIASQQQINLAMVILHDYCNRRTLWPSEFKQKITLPRDRSTAVVSVRPILKIIDAKGRYTRGRRDSQHRSYPTDYLSLAAILGSASTWQNINSEDIDFYGPTGEIWLPNSIYLVPYGEIMITYIAGYEDIPEKAIAALALIVNSVCTKGEGDLIAYTSGRVSRRFATPSFITHDIKRLLSPFVVRSLQ